MKDYQKALKDKESSESQLNLSIQKIEMDFNLQIKKQDEQIEN